MVSHVEVARFQQGHFHRQGHHHLIGDHGVVHGLVVRIHAYVIGRELIGRAEAEVQRPVGRRIQLRLEGKGRCEFLADLDTEQSRMKLETRIRYTLDVDLSIFHSIEGSGSNTENRSRQAPLESIIPKTTGTHLAASN